PTEMNRFAEAPPERQQRLLDTLTLRRWGAERDVANLVCFLASDLAGYITGTLVDVSGGMLATQIPRLAWEAAAASGDGARERRPAGRATAGPRSGAGRRSSRRAGAGRSRAARGRSSPAAVIHGAPDDVWIASRRRREREREAVGGVHEALEAPLR